MNQASSVCSGGDPADNPLPCPGEVVGGKYRLTRALGEGGMGVVFEAEHLRLRQSVAIKFLRTDVLAQEDAVERFEREARASCRIRGPHVVHVIDVDADAHGRPYIVMEMLRGRDLEAELHVRGALPIAESVDWVLQACAALSEAHAAGIVHRDLKPSNLFLAEEAGTRVLKVLDFGVSKVALDEPSATATGLTVGTPLYMAPEQVRSSRDVDARADVWSLGVILYELIAGSPPFLGTTTAAIAAIVADATPSLKEVRREVPEELDRAVMTALAKSPVDRFPDVEALGAALVPFASDAGVSGPFSLRPPLQAFEVANSAMKRAPIGPRASDSSQLLRLPTSGRTRPVPQVPRATERAVALRTFVGTVAIGVGLATGVTLAMSSRATPRAEEPPPPQSVLQVAPTSSTQPMAPASAGSSSVSTSARAPNHVQAPEPPRPHL
jgi:serine/threonine-protein kinase